MSNVCYHCGLEVTNHNKVQMSIENKQKDFCCAGCANVCQTIYLNGLGSFYHQQTNSLLPAVDLEYPVEFYDADAFQQSFLELSDERTKTIILISDTIHCAACVWLIERAIGTLDGIIWVRVSLINKRIRLSWVDVDIQLSVIMKRLADLGYAAMPYEQNIAESIANKANKAMLYRISFSAFTMMNLLWISIAMYTGAAGGEYHNYFQWLGFTLATPTLFYAGMPFLKNAFFGLKNCFMNMDVPISIGVLSTYFYSVYVLLGVSTKNEVYFDTVVNFIFVILIGRYFEGSAKKSTLSASNALQQLQPKVAYVVSKDEVKITPVGAIKIDETVLIKPAERLAVDGIVLSGDSEVDESLLTGESLLVRKQFGDEVFSGSINTSGSLMIRVTKTLNNSALGQIVSLVESMQYNKSSIICTLDKVIPYFVGTTIFLAIVTFIYWYPYDFDLALLSATSVLIITCPCAFGLATPMSIAVASGAAIKKKILIKNNDVFEVLGKVDWVVFDKTGTLTKGEFSISHIETLIDKINFINIMVSIEKHSEHPLAKAIVGVDMANSTLEVSEFYADHGQGVRGVINQQSYKIGDLSYVDIKHQVDANLLNKSRLLGQQGVICIWCANESNVLGFIALKDQIKSDTAEVVNQLKFIGKQVSILSGDSEIVTQTIASKLGIEHVIAQALPKDKADYIKQLQQNHTVLMVGDGVNDAPALVQADISIAIGAGSDVSINSADLVILKPTLSSIIELINLAKHTNNTIKQNIIFALLYNAFMVPLAMMAKVTPLFAAIVMPISSLIVIGNAARLRNK
ncbi:heavy metal translocating P-type ATPase [Candidatus Ruthia magnifica str. Cm (Calyptogena magnifica)]|uniref:Heavy metal translocating P-type ATPase n=1 Tax=Ruthia magnifica subsp. Calyptogena magnifica TaxID=413404 RepID=A1AXS6_RUTMC|nr:heavy metal translocating P-type ATPase [Candidatus Ruthturnera calyptogenae]ABL02733.1 heavy metal translocating P-type ATPase [Candidatus Ruthia magnifica str. Cm (Calyptogena magnifica)]